VQLLLGREIEGKRRGRGEGKVGEKKKESESGDFFFSSRFCAFG
jgi:hypothetical protein